VLLTTNNPEPHTEQSDLTTALISRPGERGSGARRVAVHVALPWAISLMRPRHGWVNGRPGPKNLIGLVPVAAGLAMIAWAGSRYSCIGVGWLMHDTLKGSLRLG